MTLEISVYRPPVISNEVARLLLLRWWLDLTCGIPALRLRVWQDFTSVRGISNVVKHTETCAVSVLSELEIFQFYDATNLSQPIKSEVVYSEEYSQLIRLENIDNNQCRCSEQ